MLVIMPRSDKGELLPGTIDDLLAIADQIVAPRPSWASRSLVSSLPASIGEILSIQSKTTPRAPWTEPGAKQPRFECDISHAPFYAAPKDEAAALNSQQPLIGDISWGVPRAKRIRVRHVPQPR
jgi:hypothetical protein